MKKNETAHILLTDNKDLANVYLRKLNSLANANNNLKKAFSDIVTQNIEIEFSKQWSGFAMSGQFEDKLGEQFANYLNNQKPIHRSAIESEFGKAVQPLYEFAKEVENKFKDLQHPNAFTRLWGFDGAAEIEFIPIANDGSILVTDEFKANLYELFKIYVSTEGEQRKYNLVQRLEAFKKEFQEVHGTNAPYLWQDLTMNFNPIEGGLMIRAIQ